MVLLVKNNHIKWFSWCFNQLIMVETGGLTHFHSTVVNGWNVDIGRWMLYYILVNKHCHHCEWWTSACWWSTNWCGPSLSHNPMDHELISWPGRLIHTESMPDFGWPLGAHWSAIDLVVMLISVGKIDSYDRTNVLTTMNGNQPLLSMICLRMLTIFAHVKHEAAVWATTICVEQYHRYYPNDHFYPITNQAMSSLSIRTIACYTDRQPPVYYHRWFTIAQSTIVSSAINHRSPSPMQRHH